VNKRYVQTIDKATAPVIVIDSDLMPVQAEDEHFL